MCNLVAVSFSLYNPNLGVPVVRDIRTALKQGQSAMGLVAEVGLEAVLEEMQEMTGDDMAHVTLRAAVELLENESLKEDQRIISLMHRASRVILCGSYGMESTRLAAQYNNDPGLEGTRQRILNMPK
jgi:hypothetical protein